MALIRCCTEIDEYEKARDLLKQKEGDVADGIPLLPCYGPVEFEEAMTDLETEYTVNKRDSVGHLKRRIALHVKPWFRGRRMTKMKAPTSTPTCNAARSAALPRRASTGNWRS